MLLLAAVAGTLAWSTRARAEGECAVILTAPSSPASSSPSAGELRWRLAIADVRAHLAEAAAERGDCRQIRVAPADDGATVSFVTIDGREAVRKIAEPTELRAVIDALRITPASETAEPPPAPPPDVVAEADAAPAAPAPPAADPVVERDGAEHPPSPRRIVFLVGVDAGVVFGAGDAGAVGMVEGAVLRDGWELGVRGRVEPERDGPRGPLRTSVSSVAAGLLVGHRFAVGRFALTPGGTLGVSSETEETRRSGASTRHEPGVRDGAARDGSFASARLGALFGVVAPQTGPIRMRMQLDASVAPLGRAAPDASFPELSRYAVALTLGAETGLLP